MAKNRRSAKRAKGRQRAATRRGARSRSRSTSKRYVGATAAQRVTAKQAQLERVQEMAAEDAARRAEEEAHAQALRFEQAEAELSRRRAQAEAEALAAEREAQSLTAILADIARSAARLLRTLASAPFRIGLAFVRPREA